MSRVSTVNQASPFHSRSAISPSPRAHQLRARCVKVILLSVLLGAAVLLGAGALSGGSALAAEVLSPSMMCNGSGGPVCP
jgi:hypothetical protein